MPTALIAEDEPLLAAALAAELARAWPELRIVATVGDGASAVRVALELLPEVLLFDIRMPVMDGIEATRQLAGPDVVDPPAIVIITTFDLDEYVHGALKAGARGFLLKDAGPDLLAQAVRAALPSNTATASKTLEPVA